jgi:WD40 repeat protein
MKVFHSLRRSSKIFDLFTRYSIHSEYSSSNCISDDGSKIVYAASGDLYVGIWDGNQFTSTELVKPVGWLSISNYCISGDGNVICCSYTAKTVSGFAVCGAVASYLWDGNQYNFVSEIVPPVPKAHSYFGISIELTYDGSKLLVGGSEPGATFLYPDNTPVGKVYLFTNTISGFDSPVVFTPSDPSVGMQYGHVVSISNDGSIFIVGNHNNGINKFYIYTYDGGWNETIITNNTFSTGDYFGADVDISGDGNTIAVASEYYQNKGVCVIYKKVIGVWTAVQTVISSNRTEGSQFGIGRLSNDGSVLIVGDPNSTNNSVEYSGGVYIFKKINDSYVEQEIVLPKENYPWSGFTVGSIAGNGKKWIGKMYDQFFVYYR